MKNNIFAFVALIIFVTPAHADNYLGANFAQLTYDEDGFDSVKPTAIMLRAGSEISSNLALEGRAGFGIGDDTVDVLGTSIDVEFDTFIGFYARGIVPLNRISLYGLAGLTRGKLTADANGIRVSDSETDWSYGVGADFAIGKANAINVEWASLLSKSDFDLTALSVGYKYSF